MIKLLLMYSNHYPSPDHIHRLHQISKDLSIVIADSEEVAVKHAADADIILGHRYLHQTLPHARRLKWIQSTAAGPHHLLSSDLCRIHPILTRCAAFSNIVAWHAFTLALAVVRCIPDAVQAQQRGAWAFSSLNMLSHPRVAMIVGVGEIGKELAKILHRNGIRVLGVTKQFSQEANTVCDELFYTNDSWKHHLQYADLCFVTLPLTESTTHLINESVLRALPQQAILINVGRGGVVDTNALVKVLHDGHLGGAALDVIDPIPSSITDSIWTTPRLLITPKAAAFHPEYQKKLEEYIEGQVSRYLYGEKLLDIISIDDLATETKK